MTDEKQVVEKALKQSCLEFEKQLEAETQSIIDTPVFMKVGDIATLDMTHYEKKEDKKTGQYGEYTQVSYIFDGVFKGQQRKISIDKYTLPLLKQEWERRGKQQTVVFVKPRTN